MSLPLVSIIIPMYNQRPEFLRECLQSVIRQTYTNLEVIVSDNHSACDAVQVLEEFSKDGIKIIKPLQHLDIIDHFNFAAAAATGEYISFLSSDDLLYPDCIARVVQPLIENTDLSFSYCENAIIDKSGKRRSLIRKGRMASGMYPKKEIAYRMYNYPEYWIIGGVMKLEYFRKTGFAKEIRAGDWILGFQLLKYGDVGYCNEVLSAIRFHEREGDAKHLYSAAHTLHNIQTATRHSFIIEDQELLDAIGISREQAIAYRDKEITGSVINLVRQYHKHLISKETLKKIFEVYKQTTSGFNFYFLTSFYASKAVLMYTYLLGVYGRVNKAFAAKHS
jgi:glycosyltransferase involved in cell wall biosynthesis